MCIIKRIAARRKYATTVNRGSAKAYTAPYLYTAYIYRIKSCTAVERLRSDARDAIAYRYARKSCTTAKRSIVNARHSVGNRYACKSCATIERNTANSRDRQTVICARNNYISVATTADARDGIGPLITVKRIFQSFARLRCSATRASAV